MEQKDCPFCEIAAGRIGASIICSDAHVIAFADHRPIRPGHVQIIPRVHYPLFDDVPADLAARIVLLGQRIAKAQKRLYCVERVGFVFTGNDVAHCHAHLIPLHEATDVTSARYADGGVQPIDRAQMDQTARRIGRALGGPGAETEG